MTAGLAALAVTEALYVVFISWRASRYLRRKSEEIDQLLDLIRKRLTGDEPRS